MSVGSYCREPLGAAALCFAKQAREEGWAQGTLGSSLQEGCGGALGLLDSLENTEPGAVDLLCIFPRP